MPPYEFALSNSEQHRANLTPRTKQGRPTTVDTRSPAQCTPADANHEALAGDGPLQVIFRPVRGHVGEIRGTVTVDADRGDGVRPITLEYVGQVSDDEADAFDMSGANEPQPEEEPAPEPAPEA